MDGNEYRDLNYPESDFEDKKWTDDELYDAIAYAYDAGKNNTIEQALEWLMCYFEKLNEEIVPTVDGYTEHQCNVIKSQRKLLIDKLLTEFKTKMQN